MNAFPKNLTRLPAAFLHIGAIPAAFLAGALLYEPKALNALMSAGDSYAPLGNVNSFNIVICSAIILVVMAISRITLWLIRKRFPADMWRYAFWCIGEILVCCAFTGLYLVLMDRSYDGGYFHYFGLSISAAGSVLIVPYIILTLLYMALDDSRSGAPDNDARLKFYDNRHQLKFITTAASVTFIESNENYIIVHYLENGVSKRFQIRTSMKNVEPLCEQAGFARVHRCYIINPLHIKQIRKNSTGMNFADLGEAGEEPIPISKKYYGSIESML